MQTAQNFKENNQGSTCYMLLKLFRWTDKYVSPIYWNIKNNSGNLNLHSWIEWKSYFIFKFMFLGHSKICCIFSIQPVSIRHYFLRGCKTIRLLERPSFVMNMVKNQRWRSLLSQTQALSLPPCVFQIELMTIPEIKWINVLIKRFSV